MELAMANNIDLDGIDFYNITIDSAFKFFIAGSKMVKTIDTLQRITYEIIEDYEKLNTRYLELRSTPKCLDGKSKKEYIEAIIEVIE